MSIHSNLSAEKKESTYQVAAQPVDEVQRKFLGRIVHQLSREELRAKGMENLTRLVKDIGVALTDVGAKDFTEQPISALKGAAKEGDIDGVVGIMTALQEKAVGALVQHTEEHGEILESARGPGVAAKRDFQTQLRQSIDQLGYIQSELKALDEDASSVELDSPREAAPEPLLAEVEARFREGMEVSARDCQLLLDSSSAWLGASADELIASQRYAEQPLVLHFLEKMHRVLPSFGPGEMSREILEESITLAVTRLKANSIVVGGVLKGVDNPYPGIIEAFSDYMLDLNIMTRKPV